MDKHREYKFRADLLYTGYLDEENFRMGRGTQIFQKNYFQKYEGDFFFNNYHGKGKYTYISKEKQYIYEGSFFLNTLEGYSKVYYDQGDLFEGLFKRNRRFGPGVYTYANGTQDVGIWDGNSIIRLASIIKPECIPILGKSPVAKVALIRHRNLVDIREIITDVAHNIMASYTDKPQLIEKSDILYNKYCSDDKSHLFSTKEYYHKYFGEPNYEINITLPKIVDVHTCDISQERLYDKSSCNTEALQLQEKLDISNMESKLKKLEAYLFGKDQCECVGICAASVSSLEIEANQRRDKLMQSLPSHEKTSDVIIGKIKVNYLLAWNNENWIMEMMKHVFRCRNTENDVHFSLKNLLNGHRFAFKSAGIHERACLQFLIECYFGNYNCLHNIVLAHNINPDVSDSKGNTGMFFASVADKTKVIKKLMNCGANIDSMNDEGLTPLTLCMTRYIATQNNVINWENAFINKTEMNPKVEQIYYNWRPKASLTSLEILSSRIDSKEYVGRVSSLFSFYSNVFEEVKSAKRVTEFFKDVQIKIKLMQNDANKCHLQENYAYDEDIEQKFLLDIDCIKPSKTKLNKEKKTKKVKAVVDAKAKSLKKSQSENLSKTNQTKSETAEASENYPPKRFSITEETSERVNEKSEEDYQKDILRQKLDRIFETIQMLLQCGADPNIGEVPLPSLLLSVFTKNVHLMQSLLNNNAYPDITSHNEEMTALHVTVSLPFSNETAAMCHILLNSYANPNCRTNMCHWRAENETVCPGFNIDEEVGKTPLHILAMRYDFLTPDDEKYIVELSSELLRYGGKVDEIYLGHTALTLAMIRGNIPLIKVLLEKKADPNKILGYEMGIPLTIFILKRFKDVQPLEVCREIVDLLIDNYANPLTIINADGNAIEFSDKEHLICVKQNNKNGKVNNSKEKEKINKQSNKTRKTKENIQEYLRNDIFVNAQELLFRYVQSKALKYLYEFTLEDDLDDDISEYLALFLTPTTAIKILQFYVKAGIIKRTKDFNKICRYLIEFIQKFLPSYAPVDEVAYNIKSELTLKEEVKVDHKMPELDREEQKYIVCFNCCISVGKELYLCPECCLVYFCSEECNILNNKLKSKHLCGTLFYNMEKLRHDELLAKGELYQPCQKLLNKMNRINDQRELRAKLEKEARAKQRALQMILGIPPNKIQYIPGLNEKDFLAMLHKPKARKNIYDSVKLAMKRGTTKGDKNERFKDRFSESDEDYFKGKEITKRFRKKGIDKDGLLDVDLKERHKKLARKYGASKSKDAISDSEDNENQIEADDKARDSHRIQHGEKENLPKAERDGKRKSTRRALSESSGEETIKRDLKTKNRERGGTKHVRQKGRRAESEGREKSVDARLPRDKETRRTTHETSPDKHSGLRDARLHGGKSTVDGIEDFGKSIKPARLPLHYQCFLEKLSQYFPDLDISKLLVPFACLAEDGQLYYRFLDKKPDCPETYSSI